MNLLTVCHGNVCRSVLAREFLAALLRSMGRAVYVVENLPSHARGNCAPWYIASRGTRAEAGHPMVPEALFALTAFGLGISSIGTLSARLTTRDLLDADYVLVATEEQAREIQGMLDGISENERPKIELMMMDRDTPDPTGKPPLEVLDIARNLYASLRRYAIEYDLL